MGGVARGAQPLLRQLLAVVDCVPDQGKDVTLSPGAHKVMDTEHCVGMAPISTYDLIPGMYRKNWGYPYYSWSFCLATSPAVDTASWTLCLFTYLPIWTWILSTFSCPSSTSYFWVVQPFTWQLNYHPYSQTCLQQQFARGTVCSIIPPDSISVHWWNLSNFTAASLTHIHSVTIMHAYRCIYCAVWWVNISN